MPSRGWPLRQCFTSCRSSAGRLQL